MNSFTEPTAQVIVALIPIVGIVISGIIIFFYLLWHHRQTMFQLRNNTYTPQNINMKNFSLIAGLLLSAVGLVLTVLFCMIDGLSYSLLGGLLPLALGIGLLIYNRLS
ncbi:MAG: hypothetical protein GX297_03525 [Treponema sp.]|jgi:uncharacterized membrane protein YidH (DUF202 family)|nr:hypothetical protein [Treponema sp.]